MVFDIAKARDTFEKGSIGISSNSFSVTYNFYNDGCTECISDSRKVFLESIVRESEWIHIMVSPNLLAKISFGIETGFSDNTIYQPVKRDLSLEEVFALSAKDDSLSSSFVLDPDADFVFEYSKYIKQKLELEQEETITSIPFMKRMDGFSKKFSELKSTRFSREFYEEEFNDDDGYFESTISFNHSFNKTADDRFKNALADMIGFSDEVNITTIIDDILSIGFCIYC